MESLKSSIEKMKLGINDISLSVNDASCDRRNASLKRVLTMIKPRYLYRNQYGGIGWRHVWKKEMRCQSKARPSFVAKIRHVQFCAMMNPQD